MEKEIVTRIAMHRQDIEIRTGFSRKRAQQMMRAIRKHFNKNRCHIITFEEFAEYNKIYKQVK